MQVALVKPCWFPVLTLGASLPLAVWSCASHPEVLLASGTGRHRRQHGRGLGSSAGGPGCQGGCQGGAGAAEMLPVWEPNQYQLHSTGLCSGDVAFFC